MKIPQTREEMIELCNLCIAELEKINKIFDEVIARCEAKRNQENGITI